MAADPQPGADALARQGAEIIAAGFDSYRARFRELTRRAGRRFDDRDWKGSLADAAERLDLYGHVVGEVQRRVRGALGLHVRERALWTATKEAYSALVSGRSDLELAETFLNSVTRRVFDTAGVDPNIEFIHPEDTPAPETAPDELRRQFTAPSLEELILTILGAGWFETPWRDRARDARLAAYRLRTQLALVGIDAETVHAAEVLAAPFFRRKGAYLVGLLLAGDRRAPLVLAVLNTPEGLVLDAVLSDVDDVSILFSFTRSHFHVDLDPPYPLVAYLKRVMPLKPVAELYIALGHHKHGKTELYRDLLQHLRQLDGRFDFAPGTPGMVMVVFAMPNYDVVFKVIRDHIPPIKPVTPLAVRNNYQLVFRHDRAGRLVEAQEFEHLKFERARFTEPLLEEFGREADRTVSVEDGSVVIHHSYMERRVTPLDVYLRAAAPEAARTAIVDFGQAVRDLAANNIFPGELLPKNFGVTRHGRVICYDYDELGLLTDFTFRSMPESSNDDDMFGDESWFGVGPRDVFPEEFRRFIGLPPDLVSVLDEHHADLFTVEFWTEMQDRLLRGEIIDLFPYPASARLHEG